MPAARSIALMWFSALLLAAAGCTNELHSGRGVVRFEDGEPVRAGSVELRGVSTGKHYAARIDREGGFRLTSREGVPGVPPGEYQAVVVLVVMTDRLADHQHNHGRNVPARYADYYTSDLRIDVPAPGGGPVEVVLAAE